MDPALQRRVQRYGWDRASSFYEKFWLNQLAPAQEELLTVASLKAGERILDIACGTGLVSFRAAALAGDKGFVVGTDISEKMVEVCQQRAVRENLKNIFFARMDAEELELEFGLFDKALCALGLMYMPEPVRALSEMRRMLKPDGSSSVLVWGRRDHCGWAALFEIVERRVASDVCPMFFHLGNPGMLAHAFEKAGYAKIELKTITASLRFKSAEDACGAAFAGGPVALVYHKFNDSIKKEVHQEYLESIKAFRKGKGYEIPGEFVIGRGFNP
jgi:ubiquinone/menaquinone biosynthesis C-methylase UbiE